MLPVLNAYLDGADICLVRRVDGVRRIERVPALWTAFFRTEALTRDSKAATALKRSGANLKRVRVGQGSDWIRAEWTRESDRRYMDPHLHALSHEADVDPVRRWFCDTGAKIATPRRAYFDLETDSRVPFARKEQARILAWSLVSETGREWSAVIQEDTDAAERALLRTFWSLAHRYDQLLAWNGEGFDFPVIFARTARLGLIDPAAEQAMASLGIDPSRPDQLDPATLAHLLDAVPHLLGNSEGSLMLDPRPWLWLDHLAVYDRMNTAESGDEKTSLKLNAVAHALLGEGKNDFDASKTWEAWAKGAASRENLLDYCVQDTRLLPKIEQKTGFVRLFQTLCEACSVFPDTKGLNPTGQVDGFLLRLADERGHHFPTRKYQKTVEKFKGAYVMAPNRKGIVRDVHVADFASLYPSIILSWNMSPETKVGGPDGGKNATCTAGGESARHSGVVGPDAVGLSGVGHDDRHQSQGSDPVLRGGGVAVAATGQRFRTDTPGILPIALDELLRLRKEWNDRKSSLPPGTPDWYDADRRATAYKVAANSFYGVMGSPYSRYFDKDVGEAVTQCGVWLIQSTIAEAEKHGYITVYGDTDSLFVVGATKDDFGAFVARCNVDLYPRILAERGCVQNRIKLAYEKQFERIVFTSAKRYCGRYSHYKGKPATASSKPEIKGLEYKRGDAALLARRLQSETINLLMSGCEDAAAFRALVEHHKAYVLFGDLKPEEVTLSKTLSKAIDEYVIKRKGKGADAGKTVIVPNPLAHVRVARTMAAAGEEVGQGTRVPFVVKDGGSKKTGGRIDPIRAADYDGTNADRYYLWERLVYPPTQRLLEAAFPDDCWTAYRKVPRVDPNQLQMFR